MHLLLGKSHTERKEYEHAIRLFERARPRVQHGQNRVPLVVSLVVIGLVQHVEIAHFRC